MSRLLLILAFLCLITAPLRSSADETVILDPTTADLMCHRVYILLSKVDSANTAPNPDPRVTLATTCAIFRAGQLNDSEFLDQINSLVANALASGGMQNTSWAPVRAFTQVPVALRSYSTLLLPKSYAGFGINARPLSDILEAFHDFAISTSSAFPGIVFVQADGRPDIELSTDQCFSVFLIPNCDNRILVVTTATRPDIWARDGHSPDAFVLDLKFNFRRDALLFKSLGSRSAVKNSCRSRHHSDDEDPSYQVCVTQARVRRHNQTRCWVGELVFYGR